MTIPETNSQTTPPAAAAIPPAAPAAIPPAAPAAVPTSAELEDRIAMALRHVFRAIELHSGHLLDRCSLTGPQLAVLRAVARLQPAPMGGVARSIHLSHATVSGIVDRLVARGLVTRTRSDDDRRATLLSLTTAGQTLLATSPPILPDAFRAGLTRIPDWDRLHLLSVLERVSEMMTTSATCESRPVTSADASSGDASSRLPEPS
ncbi:MAG TPA: MarR family winged helix-turn-helix transcriptional regulator [Phycisphaerales bacterium]|nr:MarR family winged helix-turn-helix transcriptional regulator [Phycisphaerales bacterium]HMP36243.1 MarR family winged helix-turn-helix transcriptional regulator [Phycisphaerales bacterium]